MVGTNSERITRLTPKSSFETRSPYHSFLPSEYGRKNSSPNYSYWRQMHLIPLLPFHTEPTIRAGNPGRKRRDLCRTRSWLYKTHFKVFRSTYFMHLSTKSRGNIAPVGQLIDNQASSMKRNVCALRYFVFVHLLKLLLLFLRCFFTMFPILCAEFKDPLSLTRPPCRRGTTEIAPGVSS
jgi:hypothetical protein